MAGIESVEEVRERRGLTGPIPERPNTFSVGVTSKGEEEEEEPTDE